jgi:glutaredoxin
MEEDIISNTCPHCGSHNVEYITRVTGFFSKVGSWNKGKIAELRDRRQAIEWNKRSFLGNAGSVPTTATQRRIKLFWKQNCPRCPAAKELAAKLEAKGIKVEYYDVESVEGMAEAGMHSVLATPSIVVVDGEDEEIAAWRGSVPSEQELAAAVMGAN